MKLRNLFLSVCSALAVFASCEQKEDLGTPSITLSTDELSFDADGGDQTFTLEASRDWEVQNVPEWVAVSPEEGLASGQPQTVTVSVLKNVDYDRTVDLKFSIGTKSKYLTVTQAGPQGSADALVVYSNDFDIVKAQNNSGWPYLDSNTNLWDNKKGTGAETVVYEYGGKMSVRTSGKLSNDNSGYSHYAGSGSNKVFFGAAPSTFKITKITLNGTSTNFKLTYGGQKYLQDGDSNFSFEEFKVYVSNDSQKWVELNESFPEDADVDGDWNLATADFTVPAGTTELGLAFVATCGSAYSIDDVNLVIGTQEGQVIDFAAGTTLDGTTSGGNTGGDNSGTPSDENAIYSNNFDKTISSKNSSNQWPYCDEFDGWKNEAGTGIENIEYAFKSASARASSSNNNIWLPKTGAYFSVQNIALNGASSLELSFNVICGSPGSYKKTFSSDVFKVYLSDNKTKWVELPVSVTANGTEFDSAVATFSVPATTTTLSITFEKLADETDGYRIDNVSLVASAAAEVAIDFTQGVEKNYGDGLTGGGDNGGETPTPPVGGGTAMTIAEVLAYGAALPSGSTIEGVVISNMDLNNLTSKKGMYVQDETAGLQFYLAENHTFAYGDKVQIDLSGVTVGAYNGAVQISNLALDKIAKVSSGNTVTPKTVTMADFLANKYEGQYIALEGVQVAASDLSNTFVVGGAHTSINMEDASGNKFVVFSSKYATYGTETVPQGSGTIKGISSINNGTIQIIFSQNSDYAGLTGTRFEGTTPPSGGDGGDSGEEPVTTNSADLETLSVNQNYADVTTTGGWKLTTCAVVTYGTANSGTAFSCIDNGKKAAVMNGRTDKAIGSIESPLISGGCGTLTFDYAFLFNESKGISFKVEVIQNEAVVKTITITKSDAVKLQKYSHSEIVNVAGDFKLKFTNLSPTNSSSGNKDRFAVWNIAWANYAE